MLTEPSDTTVDPDAPAPRKHRRLFVILGAIAILGVNALLVWLILGWRTDVAEARAEATALGDDIGALRAEESTLTAQQAMLEEQSVASADWLVALTDESAALIANADEIRSLAANLDQCASDWGSLVAQLYRASASSLSGTESEIAGRCNGYLDSLDFYFPGGELP